MAASVPFNDSAPLRIASQHKIRFLLRLEGLAVAAVSLVFYARFGADWALFALFWFAPDLSLLGYLRGPFWGARIYNAVHSYVTPATLGLIGYLLHAHVSLALALIWVNHIGVLRLLGYGLKHTDSFSSTHLGRVGRELAD
jgi:hypothetical protein